VVTGEREFTPRSLAKLYRVAVHVGGILFYEPVPIDHTAGVRARLARTGTTCMPVAVDEEGKPV